MICKMCFFVYFILCFRSRSAQSGKPVNTSAVSNGDSFPFSMLQTWCGTTSGSQRISAICVQTSGKSALETNNSGKPVSVMSKSVLPDSSSMERTQDKEVFWSLITPVIVNFLFPAGFPKAELTLESCKNFGEIVELVYRRR